MTQGRSASVAVVPRAGAAAALPARSRLSIKAFYGEYHGHKVEHLALLREHLTHVRLAAAPPQAPPVERPVVYLAGDSSLDNKYWLSDTAPAANGYDAVLQRPVSFCDVCHFVNARLEADGGHMVALNAAVEESTLQQRMGGVLLPQDVFIRDNLQPDDVLVVNVGGNDGAPGVCAAAVAAAAWPWPGRGRSTPSPV